MRSKLLKKVSELKNLERSWRVIHANGRFSKSEDVRSEIQRFAEDSSSNLRRLQRRLSRDEFKFEAAKGIPIPKLDSHGKRTGKFRPIVLAPLESRIVQRALLNILLEVPALQQFAKTPLSFGGLRRNQAEVKLNLPKHEAPSAVPAAIQATLKEIEQGARYSVTADIAAFFTRIPKAHVVEIVRTAVNDDSFVGFFEKALSVELSNLAALREKANEFPIEEIGVAQGNSLSPLMGNIVLAEFDHAMNAGDCSCIRYIDDFLILAPSEKAGNARLKKAIALLDELGMKLSPEKSSKGAKSLRDGIEFLGIQICPGFVRPSIKAQQKLLSKIAEIVEDGRSAFIATRNGNRLDRSRSLLALLKRLDGTIDGWGKHYWFCNDSQVWRTLDEKVWRCVRELLGIYAEVRNGLDEAARAPLLGLAQLQTIPRHPFEYPRTRAIRAD